MENKRGKFIVFEGPDGGGSSTQAGRLVYRLGEQGISTLQTKEPTNNIVGGLIRGLLTKQWGAGMMQRYPLAAQLLFFVDRFHHLEWEIESALNRRQWVVSDRYFFSSLAYATDEDFPLLLPIAQRCLLPDKVIYLATKTSEAVRRIDFRGSAREYFENPETLDLVSQRYAKIFKRPEYAERVLLADGTLPKDQITDLIMEGLGGLIQDYKK